STSGLKEWYASTFLPLLTGWKPQTFSPQNFWNNTCIAEEELVRIENAILAKMIQHYNIDTSHLIYDASNFFTYMDTKQPSQLAQRGHSKEKRNDLRIVGLSLLVTTEFSIPLLHESYPGNRNDAKQFAVMMRQLKDRYESIAGNNADITVVFDRGNNSEANIDLLESSDQKVHYVGGLKRNQAKDLFQIPREHFVPLEGKNFEGQTAYRTKTDVLGRTMTVVIVYNPALAQGQIQGILYNKAKITEKLLVLQEKLVRRAKGEITRGKKPTKTGIIRTVEQLLSQEYMKSLFHYEVLEAQGQLYLTFGFSDEAFEALQYDQLGKTALFTDREDFSNNQIVNAYRSAWYVEASFRQMKDTEHLSVKPIFHWTDEKIRVHIFTCVLALRLCSLLQKELVDANIHISINKMLDEMAGIKRITTFFGDLAKPEKVQSYTKGSELAKEIEALFQLREQYG
ncbi:MAG: IS1634 family transposase, partial [Spirochaetia bacterium]|nr:IS1634 family transposase [Spirochaetia bacterium]